MADAKSGVKAIGSSVDNPAPENASPDVFKQLRSLSARTPDQEVIALVWKSIRDLVSQRVMGVDGCPVPFLSEASNYALSHVIVKERRGVSSTLPGETAPLHYAAPLESLLRPNIKIEMFRSKLSVVEVPEHRQESYNLDLKDEQSNSLAIKLHIGDIRHHKLDSKLQPGHIICNMDLEGIKDVEKIFLITEVYVCQALELTVVVEKSKTIRFAVRTPTPIAFGATKCTLQQNGVLLLGEKLTGVKARGKNWQDAMGKK